jgi:multidrug resistance efflux pump
MDSSRNLLKIISRSLLTGVAGSFSAETFSVLFKQLDDSKKTINAKIEQSYTSLKEASQLIDELQEDLASRTEKMKILQEEYERYSELASIEEEKARPLLLQMDKSFAKGKNKERWVSFGINILAGMILFILGIWLGPKIT